MRTTTETPSLRKAVAATPPQAVPMRGKPVTMRADQWTRLDDLARELQDERVAKGPRITANLVIRVAIDGLLAHRDRIHGDTEAELRETWLHFLAAGEVGAHRDDDGPTRGFKTVRIRPDQWTALDDFARGLHDARTNRVRRITANTVIRVAIDGILAHSFALAGDDEEQLCGAWLDYLTMRAG